MTVGTHGQVTRWRHVWWLYLLVGAVLVSYGTLQAEGLVTDVADSVLGFGAVLATVLGIRVHRPARATAWYALALSQLIWVVGDTVGLVLADRGAGAGYPTVADVFHLVGYPTLALGLLLLLRGRRPRRDLEGLLDGATVGIGSILLCWVLLARPTAARYAESWLAATVASAYPLLDVAVLVILVTLLITPGTSTASLRLLVTAVAVLLVADTTTSALDLLATGSTAAINFSWVVSYLLVGAAALHPSMRTLSAASPEQPLRLTRRRLAATVVTVLVPAGTLVGQDLAGVPIDVWPIAIASAAMFLLVVARMNLVVQQIAAANQRRDRAQQELVFQAAHDSLTGLSNRAQALELIGASLARADRSGARVALLFVDLDSFKAVNDGYGHRAGDEVLLAVAGRMQAVVRRGDMVARLGGDEFVVLLEPVVEEAFAVVVARRLIAKVSTTVVLSGGQRVRVGASVGVAVSAAPGTDADSLVLEADSAAYRAKREGRGRVAVFDEGLRHELQARAEVERSLRAAIAADALTLLYEPVVDLATSRVLGYGALVQWERPGAGLVSATEFRPVAALSDLVIQLDVWAMHRAARQLAEWQALGAGPLRIGVAVSARHLTRSRVVDDVRSAVEASGVGPDGLVVEVSDRTLVDDPIVFGHLDEIRSLGARVGLEDFGAGQSSVRRLERLPLDAVKLEGSFIRAHGTGPGGAVTPLLVQGVQSFGLQMVARGVDEAEDLAYAREIGCDAGQGRYVGEPIEAAEVTRRHTATLAGFTP